jgi:hypothetical protein
MAAVNFRDCRLARRFCLVSVHDSTACGKTRMMVLKGTGFSPYINPRIMKGASAPEATQ